MKNKIKKIEGIVIATTLLFGSVFSSIGSFINGKAEYLNSATIVIDEELGDLNILTRTKGSYTADMVHTMIYDRLWRLDEEENFCLDLLESWELLNFDGGESSVSPLPYPNINSALGWENPPAFVELVLVSDNDRGALSCTLREGVQFHDGDYLTTESLVNLVNFARMQPTDTLIYQTWAPVVITPITNYRFNLGVDEDNFDLSIFDVMYNLASPQGSIVCVHEGATGDEGYPVGSGAYTLQQVGDNGASVELERWDNWWNTEIVPTPYVTFEFCYNYQEIFNGFGSDYYQTAVMRFGYIETGFYLEWMSGQGLDYYLHINEIEDQPYAMFFNLDIQNSMFGFKGYRQAATFALEKNTIREMGGLDGGSNDYWCYLTNDDVEENCHLGIRDNAFEYAQDLVVAGSNMFMQSEINIIVYEEGSFANATEWAYYNAMCVNVQANLTSLFGDYSCDVNLVPVSESEMAEYEANGNYDIILKEIDLHNVRSAHNALYGLGDNAIDAWLDCVTISGDVNTYKLSHLAAQYYNYSDSMFVTNLGWQKRAVIRNANVSGISVCEGFNPMGDSSTLDFRFIAVTGN